MFGNIALADTSWTTGAYSNNEDRSQTLSITDATSLTVNVSGNTEKNYDYIYIYDKDNNQIEKLHGNNLDETFEVAGDSIRARLTSDGSISTSGVTVNISSAGADVLADGTADSMLIRFTNSNQDQRSNNIFQLEQSINRLTTTSNPIILTFVEYNSQFNTTVIDISEPIIYDVIYRLVLENYVTYSEPNVAFSLASTLEPDDPYYVGFDENGVRKEQWHYKAFTSTNGGVNLPKAWAITTGQVDSKEVKLVRNEIKPVGDIVVAVIDTGITEHVDLVGNILKDNGDIYGYDFYSNDSNPVGIGFHATHVAGTIAAQSNNNEGVAGVNWQAKILPVRVLKGNGFPRGTKYDYALDMSSAIIWAAGGHIDSAKKDNVLYPANVINMSIRALMQCSNPYVKDSEKSTIQNAINIATNLGTIIVVAAGNDNKDASLVTPANCENVITVGATQQDNNKYTRSNYGDKVDVSAPGTGILSTYPTDRYAKKNGTSMAAPHVAGIASLMLAQNPDLTPMQVEAIIKKSVNNFPSSSNCPNDESKAASDPNVRYCGTGIIDAYQAVINSQITLLSLGNSEPVKKSEHGQTLYKFKYLDADGYSGVKEFSINFNRTAGTTRLYIKKNDLPDTTDNNGYDCMVTYNGSSESNNEVSINACLKDIKLAYGDLLYIQTKASGVSNDNEAGNISVAKTHPPVWSGDLEVGKSRTHAILAGHGDGELRVKFTLNEVVGEVRIKIIKVTDANGNERKLTLYKECISNDQGSCSVEVVLQNNEAVFFEVENMSTTSASYKIAVNAESSFEQTGQVVVAIGSNNSTDWWSYTHENVPNASNGPRIVKAILSDFTDVSDNPVSADLDLYTKQYATNNDISNDDITISNFDCRPYSGGNSVETCKAQYNTV